uniref:FBA domain-containing protein n=1 Tax=Erpetoichthys calabaricus TaxID=27687 RepID=A0A8C4T7R0_ERPCA
WGGSIKKRDASRLDKLVRKAGFIVGTELDSLTSVAERQALSSEVSDDILFLILIHVPFWELRSNCRLVCKRWKDVVDSQALWRVKYEQVLSKKLQTRLPSNTDWKNLFYKLFARNLIKNPCGDDGFEHWNVNHGGDGWVIERHHGELKETTSSNCFAVCCSVQCFIFTPLLQLGLPSCIEFKLLLKKIFISINKQYKELYNLGGVFIQFHMTLPRLIWFLSCTSYIHNRKVGKKIFISRHRAPLQVSSS